MCCGLTQEGRWRERGKPYVLIVRNCAGSRRWDTSDWEFHTRICFLICSLLKHRCNFFLSNIFSPYLLRWFPVVTCLRDIFRQLWHVLGTYLDRCQTKCPTGCSLKAVSVMQYFLCLDAFLPLFLHYMALHYMLLHYMLYVAILHNDFAFMYTFCPFYLYYYFNNSCLEIEK